MKTKLFFILTAVMVFASCGYNPPQTPNSPQASFSYEKSHPFYVHFKNKSKNATSCEWDFGDGKTSREASPVHQYASKGVYKVTLKAISLDQRDFYTTNVTITEPTTCYVSGIVFEKVPKNNEYYSVRCTDDYILFETCYWYTNWVLLSSANLPYTLMFKYKQEIDFGNSKVVTRLYQNSKSSGTGKQVESWNLYPSNILSGFWEVTKATSDNAEIRLLFEWED